MIDYNQIANQANDALISVRDVSGGQSGIGVLVKRGVKVGDAHNPDFSSDKRFTCNGLQTRFKSNEVNGDTILMSDLKILVTDLTVVPTPADHFIWIDQTLRIIDVMPLAPAGVPVFYKLQCRA